MFARNSAVLCLIVAAATLADGQQLSEGDSCLQVVQKIAEHDEKFTRRLEQKTRAVASMGNVKKQGCTTDQLSEQVNHAATLDGVYSSSKSTADWVMDVLRGKTNCNPKPGLMTDGAELSSFFKKHAESVDSGTHRILFHIRLQSGVRRGDHELVVEQTPRASEPQYRIFQSREEYGLKAWLAPGEGPDRDQHIYANLRTRVGRPKNEPDVCVKDKSLLGVRKTFNACMANIEKVVKDNKVFPDLNRDALLKFRTFIEDDSKQRSTTAFEKAWKQFGGGNKKPLTKADIFDGENSFVQELGKHVAWLKSEDEKDKIVKQEDCDRHQEMFGAALLSIFPGLPKELTGRVRETKLFVDIQKLAMEDSDKACVAEGRRIAGRILTDGTAKPGGGKPLPKKAKTCGLPQGPGHCRKDYYVICEQLGSSKPHPSLEPTTMFNTKKLMLCDEVYPALVPDETSLDPTKTCFDEPCSTPKDKNNKNRKIVVCVKAKSGEAEIWMPALTEFTEKGQLAKADGSKDQLQSAIAAKLDLNGIMRMDSTSLDLKKHLPRCQ